MRRLITAVLLVAVAACGPRQVEVRTAPQSSQNEPTIHFTNNLGQAVNVYVRSGGNDIFLQQVNANTTASLPVHGVQNGTSVELKATTIDGVRTYQPPTKSVVLNGTYSWTIP